MLRSSQRRGGSGTPLSSPVSNRGDGTSVSEPETGQSEASSRFVLLQKWEGEVLSTNGSTFRARLLDLTGDNPDQEAEIRVAEVSPRDRNKIRPRGVFYWYIGYRDSLNGERERASKFYFRRLPQLEEHEVERARRAAAELRSALGWQ
jgi:hypothetical protein